MLETLQSEAIKAQETASDANVIALLARYRMLHQFLAEVLIDQAVAGVNCTQEEQAQTGEQFFQRNQITTEAERQAWLEQSGITLEQVIDIATRGLKIEKFKQANWGHKLESYFLSRKSQLDKVLYSLIRVKDVGIAHELYFRIQEGEQSFAELARQYSEGPEAQTGGLMGPFELGRVPQHLARLLATSRLGQLWPPFQSEGWFMILRLEKLMPVQLDELIQQRLLDELFENWLQEQVRRSSPEKILMHVLAKNKQFGS